MPAVSGALIAFGYYGGKDSDVQASKVWTHFLCKLCARICICVNCFKIPFPGLNSAGFNQTRFNGFYCANIAKHIYTTYANLYICANVALKGIKYEFPK